MREAGVTDVGARGGAADDDPAARPLVDRAIPMEKARDGFAAMAEGDVFGKIVFTR